MSLIDTIPHVSKMGAHAPWPRAILDEAAWSGTARDLAAGRRTLVSLWADQSAVHMALLDETARDGAVVRRRECARLRAHSRDRAEPRPDRTDPGAPAGWAADGRNSVRRRHPGGPRPRRIVPRRRLRLVAHRRRRLDCALPSARPLLVPVAALGGRDRRKHRGRLSSMQQVVQLLLFGA